MPVPTPNPNEKQADFIARCMKFLMDEDPDRDEKQALAICYSQWRSRESMHPDFIRVYDKFKRYFGDVEGVLKFEAFIEKNKLNVARLYHPKAQFYESFGWAKPLIQFMRQDKDAKYYAVRALTADISMKGADWSDYNKMTMAAPSMNYRPLNYLHNHSTWLPFPRTRVDYAKADDFSVEATLRIDNAEKLLQKQLDHDPSIPEKQWINSVSIEARPEPDGNYHFIGLALIPSGADLPGDPCTEIFPIAFNESIGHSICKIYDGKLVCECQKEVKESIMTETKNKINLETPKEEIEKTKTPETEVNKILENEFSTKQYEETIAKKDTQIADLSGELAELSKEFTTLKTESMNKDKKLIEANEKQSALTKENVKLGIDLSQIPVLKESIVAKQSEINDLRGKNEGYTKTISTLETEVNKEHARVLKLEESMGKLSAENEGLRRELNEESTRRASAEQKALNETKECNRVKLENAEVLGEIANHIKNESVLSDRLSEAANRALQLTKENADGKAELLKLKETMSENNKIIERLESMNKKSHKLFEKYGIVELDTKTGKLQNPV